MKLHPLLNPDITHYNTTSGAIAIKELEKQLTVNQMIGWCKGNIFKYEFRKELKGKQEEDKTKIKTFKKYLAELEDMCYFSLNKFLVCDAILVSKREWAYSAEELKTKESLFDW